MDISEEVLDLLKGLIYKIYENDLDSSYPFMVRIAGKGCDEVDELPFYPKNHSRDFFGFGDTLEIAVRNALFSYNNPIPKCS